MRVTRVLCIAVAAWTGAAQAANFSVDSVDDAGDATPGDGICASNTATCTVRAAIEEANALAGADAVTVGAGTYRLLLGRMQIADDLTLAGAGAEATILRGKGAGGGSGSGFDVLAGAVVELSDLTLRNLINFGHGGAIANDGTLTLRDVVVAKCRARDMTAPFGQFAGGAIFNTGTLTVVDSSLLRNRATVGGGALYNLGTAVLSRATIARNRTRDTTGGGILNGGSVTLENVTVTKNRARSSGGGIRNGGGASVALTNVTLAGNRSVAARQLDNFVGGPVSLRNTIIAGQESCRGSLMSLGFNLDGGTTCGLAGPSDLSGVDPRLGRLRDNGGPSETADLRDGSPAIDGGDPVNCPATDQRGVARPQGGGCDIGAFERVP